MTPKVFSSFEIPWFLHFSKLSREIGATGWERMHLAKSNRTPNKMWPLNIYLNQKCRDRRLQNWSRGSALSLSHLLSLTTPVRDVPPWRPEVATVSSITSSCDGVKHQREAEGLALFDAAALSWRKAFPKDSPSALLWVESCPPKICWNTSKHNLICRYNKLRWDYFGVRRAPNPTWLVSL